MRDKLRYIGVSIFLLLALVTFGFYFFRDYYSVDGYAVFMFMFGSLIGGFLLYRNYSKSGYFIGLLISIMFGLIGFGTGGLAAIGGATCYGCLTAAFLSIPIALASIWGVFTAREYKKEIIEKALGEEIELATLKYTVNGAEEKPAKDSTKFVFVDLSITNISNASFTFPAAPFVLIDDKKRSFRPMAEAGDQYLTGRQLAPGKTEKGFIVYEIPTDAASYGISTGKKGTEEVYKVILKRK